MLLGDVINDVNARLANTLTDDDIIRQVNYVLAEVGKTAGRTDIFSFDAIKGISLYPLPSYVRPESFRTVTVGDEEYYPSRLSEEARGCVYYIAPDGYIGFNPPPHGRVLISYAGAPALLTLAEMKSLDEDNLSDDAIETAWRQQKIELEDEYCRLVPLFVAIAAADAMEDISLANNLRGDYNALYRQAQQGRYLKRGKYPITRALGVRS